MSFGLSYANDSYDNLVEFVKDGKFSKFKNLYLSSNLTNEQKNELIKIADEVIETEKKNWPKDFLGNDLKQWGHISSTTGKRIKEQIKMLTAARYLILLAVIPCSCFLFKPLRNLASTLKKYFSIQKGIVPLGVTAADEVKKLDTDKTTALDEIKGVSFPISMCIVFSYLYVYIVNQGKKVLANYKRFKGATKIKQLLEGSLVV